MTPLKANEVRKLILTFWRLNAGKAPVAEFIPILDPGFALVAVDSDGNEVVRYDGLAGLEEHQYGKQIYYDQRFTLRSIHTEIESDRAIASTTGEWRALHCEPRMAKSERLWADLGHTWYAGRRPDGTAALNLHVCTYFQYRPGYAPAADTVGNGREIHLDFDQYWSSTAS